MAPGPTAGADVRYARMGRATFALARRICGDDAVAADVVAQAFELSVADPDDAVGDGLLLRRVRELACRCRRRSSLGPAALGTPPPALAGLPQTLWNVLDLVALRGAGVREAAMRLQLPEDVVLSHLREALRLTRELLSGAGEPHDHADAPRLALLG